MLKRCLLILLLGIILSGCQKNEVGYIGQTDDMGTDIIEQTVTEEENFVDIVIGKTKRQEKILLKCLDTYLIPQFGICSEYLNKNESNTIQVECFKSDGNLEMLQKQVTGIQDVFIEDFDNDGNLEMFLVVINGEDTIDYANNCDFCLYKYSVREDEFEERQYETRESGIFSYLNREYIIDGNVVDGTIIEMMSLQIGAQYLENVAISFYNDIDEAAKSVLLEEVTQSTDKKGYYQYQFLNVENEEKKYPSLPVMTAVFTSFERGVENHIEESVMRYIGTTEQNGMTVYISDMEQEVEPLFEYPFDYENAKEAFYKDMSQYNLGIYADEDKRSPMFKIECLNGTDNYQYAYTSFNNHNYLFDYIDKGK